MRQASLIVGGDSLIGAALRSKLEAKSDQVVFTSRRGTPGSVPLDLDQAPHGWSLPEADATVAYVCAAVTGPTVDHEPELSQRINVDHTKALIDRLTSLGSFVVFLSSDRVSCKDDRYGQQKRMVERHVMDRRGAILRLGKVLSPQTGLLSEWVRSLRHSKPIHPFSNAHFGPVPLGVVLETLLRIGKSRQSTVSTLGGTPPISYSDAIGYVADRLGLNRSLITPVSSARDVPRPARGCGQPAGTVRLTSSWAALDHFCEAYQP